MKTKRINLAGAALVIKVGMVKVWLDFDKSFDEYPEDPNGVEVTDEQVRMGLKEIEKFALVVIENLVGKLPDVEIPVEPEPDLEEVEEIEQEDLPYETKFHHTMTDTKFTGDGGTSLVSCPGQHWGFVSVYCNGIRIPRHRSDSHRDEDDREGYWNMFEAPVGDIIATDKNGKKYRFKTKKDGMIKGSCK